MINYVLVGAGTIGEIHAYNIKNTSDINLSYVIDKNTIKAAKLAKIHNCKFSNNLQNVLSQDSIDAVIIASSSSAHEEHILVCIEFNKPFICEKPLSTSLISSVKCYERSKQSGIIACMGLNRRLHKDYIKAQ